MANWYGSSRSNYIKVKDPEAFKQWINQFDIELWDDNSDGSIAFGAGGDGYWPSELYNQETGEETQVDFAHEVSKHLVEGSVLVLVSAGAEKLRYITGSAIAIDHRGELIEISLDDIYKLATEKFGSEPTSATY